MDIKRFINQNNKLIMYIIFIIIFVFLIIKSLNAYYEKDAQEKLENIRENNIVNDNSSNNVSNNENNQENTNLNSVEGVMSEFIKYCNNREIENAYEMLTDECKNALYNTKEKFERVYINNVFNEKKEYSMIIWDDAKNMQTYKVKLFGDILATGGEGNVAQQFYTFIKTEDTYKININDYIYGKNLDKESEDKGVLIKIKNINVYNSYEEYELSFTNNTSKEICLTGNKYVKNIYLKNSRGTTYSSLNSKFDNGEITLEPGVTQNYKVKFNKIYNSGNKVNSLVLSDVILDYEEYKISENKNEYQNRTSIEINF